MKNNENYTLKDIISASRNITNKIRSTGVGKQLMEKMEEYFKSMNCEYVHVDVFGYNERGINFYQKQDYHTRMKIMIKKISK